MWNYGWHMGGMWGGMWLGWLVFLLLIVFVVWAITTNSGSRVPLGGADDPETLLKRRYARGEIDRDEYQHRLDDLRR